MVKSSPPNDFMDLKGFPVLGHLTKRLSFSLLLNYCLKGEGPAVSPCRGWAQAAALLSLTRKAEHVWDSRATWFSL